MEKKRVAQSVAVGCLTGAIVAQLAVQGNPKFEGEIGQVLGQLGLDKKTVIAAIGCGAGKLSGDYVNSRSREYGNAQAGYKAMIAAADRDIARYKSLNDTTSRLIKQQRAKIASLNKQYKAKQITKQQYRDQIASSKDNVKVIDAQRTDLKKQVTLMKKDSKALAKSGTNPNSLNQKIVSLEKQLIALDNQRTAMVKAYNDVPPEVQRVPL